MVVLMQISVALLWIGGGLLFVALCARVYRWHRRRLARRVLIKLSSVEYRNVFTLRKLTSLSAAAIELAIRDLGSRAESCKMFGHPAYRLTLTGNEARTAELIDRKQEQTTVYLAERVQR